jgi:hypothetical protein
MVYKQQNGRWKCKNLFVFPVLYFSLKRKGDA